jgi:glucose/arabinose dehydrogenase
LLIFDKKIVITMKNLHSLLFIICSFFILWTAPQTSYAQPTISFTEILSGLSQPMQVVHAGDGSQRIFIPQKTGGIRVFDKNYNSLGTFLTLSGILTGGEQGLLSLCFHPDYETNRLFFVYYVNSGGDLEVAQYKASSSNPNIADVSSKKVVITIPHPTFSNHNGGTLRFGPDGHLYLSTGDGGSSGDPSNNAQNTNILLGKMLRISIDTTATTAPFYSIPAGNPFGNEVAAYGLRNPFRWNFDRLTGDMWIGDVGQNALEEFNRVRADSILNVNYGWRCYEGTNTYNTSIGCATTGTYKFPFLTYPTINPSSAIGGTVYRGETFIALRGYYLGADFYSGKVYKVLYDSTTKIYTTSSQTLSVTSISDFGEIENGEILVPSLSSGKVFRLESDGAIQYTFVGNGNWSNAANWLNGMIPPSNSVTGSIIAIRPSAGGECIVDLPVSIAAGTNLLVENNKTLKMSSNISFL